MSKEEKKVIKVDGSKVITMIAGASNYIKKENKKEKELQEYVKGHKYGVSSDTYKEIRQSTLEYKNKMMKTDDD